MVNIIAEYEDSFAAPVGCGDTMEEAEFLANEWLGLQDPSRDEAPVAITYWARNYGGSPAGQGWSSDDSSLPDRRDSPTVRHVLPRGVG
jgi:hypothetical protein